MQILKTDCPACGVEHEVFIQPAVAPQTAMREWDALRNALADERERAQTAAARHRKEIESYRAVIDDATKRYSYLFDGWRKAQNNEEIAEVVRKAMFNWQETRAALYERKDTMTAAPDPPPDPGPLDDDCPPTCPDECPDHGHGRTR
jgi:hypothetical protein